MNRPLGTGVSAVAARTVYALFGLLAVFVLSVWLFAYSSDSKPLALSVCGAGLLALSALYLLHRRVRRREAPRLRWALPVLLALCFAVRLTWVLAVRIDPRIDYDTFYMVSRELSEGFAMETAGLARYVALFPHIFGYASFLGLVFRITGPSPLAAAIVNVLLSTLSAALVYYIGKRLVSPVCGLSACLLWSLFPSQIVYNMFVLSEPYYTTLLLAFFALLLRLREPLSGMGWRRLLPLGALLGLLLGLVNTARPVGSIAAIALALWLLLCRPYEGFTRELARRAAFLVCTLALLLAVSRVNGGLFVTRVGQEPSASSGYSVCVGFNMDSLGTWNEADAQLLYHYSDLPGYSATDAQSAMLDEALSRIRGGEVDFLRLFPAKLRTLWVGDAAAVAYAEETVAHPRALSALCDGFYWLLWLLSLVGAAAAFRRRERGALCVVALFVLGLTAAHMLTEVAARYHYSGAALLTLTAAWGLSALLGRQSCNKEEAR